MGELRRVGGLIFNMREREGFGQPSGGPATTYKRRKAVKTGHLFQSRSRPPTPTQSSHHVVVNAFFSDADLLRDCPI